MKFKDILCALFITIAISQTAKSNQVITITDIYSYPIAGVTVQLYHANDPDMTALLGSFVTNDFGNCSISEYDHGIQMVIYKPSYLKRFILIEHNNFPPTIILPPEESGLFFNTIPIEKVQFKFEKAPRQGLSIPAYYDGTYSISGNNPATILPDQSLYLVADNRSTLGQNIIFSENTLYLCPVSGNDVFATYNKGRLSSQRAKFVIETILNATDKKASGLVHTKIQVFKLSSLPSGEYVLFIGGGNMLDNEPHPNKESGCYYLQIAEE